MRYEDEDADRVARVLVRVEWANGKIREYEAEDPEGFQINDPERDITLAPMRMTVQALTGPVVPMIGATSKVELSFRLRFQSNPRRALQIRTERTASRRENAATPPTRREPAAMPQLLQASPCDEDPSEDPREPSA